MSMSTDIETFDPLTATVLPGQGWGDDSGDQQGRHEGHSPAETGPPPHNPGSVHCRWMQLSAVWRVVVLQICSTTTGVRRTQTLRPSFMDSDPHLPPRWFPTAGTQTPSLIGTLPQLDRRSGSKGRALGPDARPGRLTSHDQFGSGHRIRPRATMEARPAPLSPAVEVGQRLSG
jgi:hypothetical protein